MKRTVSVLAALGAWALFALLGPATSLGQAKFKVQVSPTRIGKYQKVEFTVEWAERAQYTNPFDPDEVALDILLKAPSGKRLTVPAFFCQPFQRKRILQGGRETDWLYPHGKPVWMARFAPAEIGQYLAVARLKDREGQAQSEVVKFESVPSASQGFLRVSQKDPRFLEFTEGGPFFAVGQNLAFIGEMQYVTPAKVDVIFDKLAANGANFLRIWTCCEDWALALESRRSAWGRSWAWKPPFAPLPDAKAGTSDRQCVKLSGNDGTALAVSPSHRVALRPGTPYLLSARLWHQDGAAVLIELNRHRVQVKPTLKLGWSKLAHEFTTGQDEFWLENMSLRLQGGGTVFVDSLSLREAAGGPELLWEADPNRALFGQYSQVDCFLLDELVQAAERRGLYLQLCFMTRDQYMRMLKKPDSPEYQQAIQHAKKLIRYVVARWGYSTSVGAWEYFNEIDPNLPTDRFYDELGQYFERIDICARPRTTSAWSPSPKDYRHPRIDIAEPHYYLRPADRKKIREEVSAVLERAQFVRQHAPNKPALLGEFGLATDDWRPCDEMKKDRQYVHFHNALWASALSGLSGTAMFWWWEDIDAKDAYRHYRPLARYLADIPFTTAGFKQAAATASRPEVRVVGLQGRERAYLWLISAEATWADHLDPDARPSTLRGLNVQVKDLAPGVYRVQWWDTNQGQVVQEAQAQVISGVLELAVPQFKCDIACKILPVQPR